MSLPGMKLYLSSLGIPDKKAYLALFPTGKLVSVGIIANAWDVYAEAKAKPYIQARLRDFEEMGCKPQILDLKRFKDEPKRLRQSLQQFDAVWVTGGNIFYLNWLMRQSGFSDIIKKLAQDGLMYGGESAGATIAGPTLHGAEHLDDPNETPKIIWDGLGLTDVAIVPHWGKEKYADSLEQCRQQMQQHTRKVKTLTDEQYILINTPKQK